MSYEDCHFNFRVGDEMQKLEEVKVANIDYDVIVENIQYSPQPTRPKFYTPDGERNQ